MRFNVEKELLTLSVQTQSQRRDKNNRYYFSQMENLEIISVPVYNVYFQMNNMFDDTLW